MRRTLTLALVLICGAMSVSCQGGRLVPIRPQLFGFHYQLLQKDANGEYDVKLERPNGTCGHQHMGIHQVAGFLQDKTSLVGQAMKGSNCTESFILDQSNPNIFTRTFDVFVDPNNANRYYVTVQGKQTVSGTTSSPTGIRFGNLGPVTLGQETTTPNTGTGVLFGDGGSLWLPIPSPNNLFSFTARSLNRTNRYGDGVFEFLAASDANYSQIILVVDGAFSMDADFKN